MRGILGEIGDGQRKDIGSNSESRLIIDHHGGGWGPKSPPWRQFRRPSDTQQVSQGGEDHSGQLVVFCIH